MNESLLFQRYAEKVIKPAVEEARVQAFEQGAIEILLGLLETRFQPAAVRNLRPLLERIDDVERLKALAPAAAQAESLEMFLEALSPDS